MNSRTKLGLIVAVFLVLTTLTLAQVNSYRATKTVNKVIDSKNEELELSKKALTEQERISEALRTSREEWQKEAEENSNEKVIVNCVQFDMLNNFISILTTAIINTEALSPEQTKDLTPFSIPQARPSVCP